MIIRPYRPQDRHALRQICCETADCGAPMESFFHDRELLADLVTRYYTDFESMSSWVAEENGRIVGYLNGCLDTQRQQRVMAVKIVPVAMLKAILRGLFFRLATWRIMCAIVRTAWRRRSRILQNHTDAHPAHLHVNVKKEVRGALIGRRLVECFFKQAKDLGIPGVHASVREDNVKGCSFFQQLGFVILSRRPLLLPRKNCWLSTNSIIYGKTL